MSYFCYSCNNRFTNYVNDFQCPNCLSHFIEELAGSDLPAVSHAFELNQSDSDVEEILPPRRVASNRINESSSNSQSNSRPSGAHASSSNASTSISTRVQLRRGGNSNSSTTVSSTSSGPSGSRRSHAVSLQPDAHGDVNYYDEDQGVHIHIRNNGGNFSFGNLGSRGLVAGPGFRGGTRGHRNRHMGQEDMFQNFISMMNAAHGGGIFQFGGDQMFGDPNDYAATPQAFQNILTQLMNDLDARANGPPPASGEAIRNLPEATITQEKVRTGLQCHICFEVFTLGEKVTMLPCAHEYHKPCIDKWLEMHGTCPICRKRVDNEDQEGARRGPGNSGPRGGQPGAHDGGGASRPPRSGPGPSGSSGSSSRGGHARSNSTGPHAPPSRPRLHDTRTHRHRDHTPVRSSNPEAQSGSSHISKHGSSPRNDPSLD